MYLDEWGPIAWSLFHYITYTYKPNLKEYYNIFFSTLNSIIPCPHCSNDIKNILITHLNHPVHFTLNKDELIDWLIKIHNLVNKKLGKPDTFNRQDADNKYLINNDISIDHTIILKFMQLSMSTKGKTNAIDNDLAFKRNLIALCCIYPTGIESYNPNLMYFINYATITNKTYNEWYTSFEKIVLNSNNKKPWDSNIKYPIRDLHYNDNKLKHLELFSVAANKIFNKDNLVLVTDYPKNKYSSIIINSSNTNPVMVNKEYKILNDLDKCIIYILGRTFSKTGHINVTSHIQPSTVTNIKINEIRNSETTITIEYTNLKKNSVLNILFEVVDKNPGDAYMVNDICLIGM